jgi:exosome complex component RRP40
MIRRPAALLLLHRSVWNLRHRRSFQPEIVTTISIMSSSVLVLPGQELTPDQLPSQNTTRTLTLGPGLRHIPPVTIVATQAGELCTDSKKNAIWIENLGGRYLPHTGDLVVAVVQRSSTDTYHCTLTPHTPSVLLGQLAFEGATKKTRPQLNSGALVYARVSKADKWSDVEIECVNPATGKSDGLGPLKAGMLFDVSPAFARRLMMGAGKGGVVLLEEIGEKVRFEVAVGRNGKVWVDSSTIAETVAIGRCLTETDEKDLDLQAQKKLVNKMIKSVWAIDFSQEEDTTTRPMLYQPRASQAFSSCQKRISEQAC